MSLILVTLYSSSRELQADINSSFRDSIVTNSTNGPRIKTNYNSSGTVTNATFSNIALSNIKNYGIDIEQDYLNGGASGVASSGVLLHNIMFENIKGWVVPASMNYYVLCGDGSCSDFTFKDVDIRGGGLNSSCNCPLGGCPGK
jgi:polygalacturonase